MQFSLFTLLILAASVSAHMVVTEPPQWLKPEHAQDPDAADGSDFPCQALQPGPVSAQYTPGQRYDLKLKGSAVHGGGSAQMLISYQFPPSKDPKDWHVLTSFQGEHPQSPPDANYMPANAELPNPGNGGYKFLIHEGLPAGKAIVAWSWYNKIGNREHYMKCSTVAIGGSENEISGGARDDAVVKSLPTMFKANDGECVTPASINLQFPYPGSDVVNKGVLTPVDPSLGCIMGEPGSGSGSGDSGAKPKPTSTYMPTSTPNPQDEESTNQQPTPPAPAYPSSTAPGPSPTPKPQSETPGGACSPGTIVCGSSGSTWSQCVNGALVDMGPVAPGTTCSQGAMVKRDSRRALRAHRRARVFRH